MYGVGPGSISFFALIFGFVIVMVIIKTIGSVFRERARAQADDKKDDMFINYDLRLKKLEERITNLETIVLEQERYKKFSSL